MKYSLYAGIDNKMDGYWIPAVVGILKDVDIIRIDCWNDNRYICDDIKSLAYKIDTTSYTNMTILWFEKTDDAVQSIIFNSEDTNGQLKWFSLFLYCNDKIMMSIEHHGQEFIVSSLEDEEINRMKNVLPEGTNPMIY